MLLQFKHWLLIKVVDTVHFVFARLFHVWFVFLLQTGAHSSNENFYLFCSMQHSTKLIQKVKRWKMHDFTQLGYILRHDADVQYLRKIALKCCGFVASLPRFIIYFWHHCKNEIKLRHHLPLAADMLCCVFTARQTTIWFPGEVSCSFVELLRLASFWNWLAETWCVSHHALPRFIFHFTVFQIHEWK